VAGTNPEGSYSRRKTAEVEISATEANARKSIVSRGLLDDQKRWIKMLAARVSFPAAAVGGMPED
jgi:hypothetical protein